MPVPRRTTYRATLGLVVAVAVAMVVAATLDARATTAAERQAAAEARAELSHDLTHLRNAAATPARSARTEIAALRRTFAEAITGSDRDVTQVLDEVEARIAAIEEAADQLTAAAGLAHPAPASILPVGTTAPILSRLDALDAQTLATSDRLRAAVSDISEVARAAVELRRAAKAFAAAADELPDSDDPDRVAEAWIDELDRLAPYREAADAAAAHATLEPLASAHLLLLDDLEDFARAAVDDLEAGDLETYEDRRTAALATTDEVVDRFTAATHEALQRATADIEAAEERALGLLHELEALRRATPARAAVPPRT